MRSLYDDKDLALVDVLILAKEEAESLERWLEEHESQNWVVTSRLRRIQELLDEAMQVMSEKIKEPIH